MPIWVFWGVFCLLFEIVLFSSLFIVNVISFRKFSLRVYVSAITVKKYRIPGSFFLTLMNSFLMNEDYAVTLKYIIGLYKVLAFGMKNFKLRPITCGLFIFLSRKKNK